MRFGEACHERIQSGLKFKDHQKAEKVIKLIHDANFLLKVSPNMLNLPKMTQFIEFQPKKAKHIEKRLKFALKIPI